DSNNVNDYIIKDWTYFSLFGLGIIDSVTFKMYSSDTNSFGIKTPAYFCLDNLISGVESSDDFQQLLDVKTYPNPFSQYIQCQNNTSNEVSIAISDIQGRICLQEKINPNQSASLTTYNLQQGIYFLKMSDGKHTFTKKIIKSLD
nr:T9SS type A sorting domain-containing protein [Chitinophagaceae bacterium]